MNLHSLRPGIVSALAMLLLGGCAKPVVFSTHTSIGLDVSGTAQYPNKVSFSYNRQEAALVPRQTNGAAHSVFGGLDSDISFWKGSVIKQTFATGEAAKIATGGGDGKNNTSTNPATGSLVFFAGTTFGLHLTTGESQMSPNLLMGYRRAEAAYIPVPDPGQEVRSVYADVLINTKSRDDVSEGEPALVITTNFPTISGVRIKQSFATGRAAENLASSIDVQAKLNAAAGTAVGAIERSRARARALQRDITLEVSRLKESQLDAGGDAMKGAGLADDAGLAEFKQASAFDKSRLLRDIARDLESETQVMQLEKYLVLLRDIK